MTEYDFASGINQKDISSSSVLIVEDMKLMRMMIGGMLEEAGFKNLMYAADGIEGLEKVQEFAPDIIILDLNMPRMTGIEMCKRIRAEPTTADIPILVQSMMESPQERNEAFEAGATDFIRKPINPPELIARINIHLENKYLIKKLKIYKERVSAELELARDMQQNLLPRKEEIESLNREFGIEIKGHTAVSSELGGDFWSAGRLLNGNFYFYVIDVSGHGVAAALNVFRANQVLKHLPPAVSRPSDILNHLNKRLVGLMPSGQFLTMFCGVFDAHKRQLIYSSAAQPRPIHVSINPMPSVQGLMSDGSFIGAFENVTFDDHTLMINKGEVLFVYSDALIETPDGEGNILGEEGLLEIFASFAAQNKPPFIEKLIKDFDNHYRQRQTDDLTMLEIIF